MPVTGDPAWDRLGKEISLNGPLIRYDCGIGLLRSVRVERVPAAYLCVGDYVLTRPGHDSSPLRPQIDVT